MLLRFSAEDHLLLVVLHHIVVDGWSMSILLSELGEAYQQGAAVRQVWKPLAVQYGDYAEWQRDRLSGTTLQQELDYWREQLRGVPAHLALPTDRPRPAVQGLAGAIWPVPLDAALTSRLRLRQTTLEAYAHQDVPFERLVEELAPERTMSHAPLIQVAFTLQSSRAAVAIQALHLETLEPETSTARFDLSLGLEERADCLAGGFEYRTDLFDEAGIAALAASWERLLRAVATDPDVALAQIALVAPSVASAPAQPSSESLVPALDRTAVEHSSEAVALLDEESTWTCRRMDQESNGLAHYLRRHGVGKETVVAVCLPRSAWQVVSLFAIWKTGAAYLPLDPQTTADWRSYVLHDSGARVVLDGKPEERAGRDDSDGSVSVSPADLAYLIYTSGSTGLHLGFHPPSQRRDGVPRLAREPDRVAPPAVLGQPPGSCLVFEWSRFRCVGLGNLVRVIGRGHPVDPRSTLAIPDEDTQLRWSNCLWRHSSLPLAGAVGNQDHLRRPSAIPLAGPRNSEG